MSFPKRVKIVEVGPRDGLQNEKNIIPTDTKVAFINLLSATGVSVIEVTSFVSPKWVPQLADGKIVFESIQKQPGLHYPVLVPNVEGLENALAAGVREIAVFSTASEQFSEQNTHCSVKESMQRMEQVLLLAKQHKISVRAYLSCVLGCPYEGEVAYKKTAELAEMFHQLGCYEISLGDTIGAGTPFKMMALLEAVTTVIPIEKVAVHCHDTYGQALVNIYAALSLGVAIVDSAVSGLGGCPYAKGATGNVATEDVLYMLAGMNIETGVDLQKMIAIGRFISNVLQRPSQSRVTVANLQ